jgi:hypothetical protein
VKTKGLGTVAHTYNPSYFGGGHRRIKVQGQLEEKKEQRAERNQEVSSMRPGVV